MFEWFVFLFVFFWMRRATYTACPGCMRKFALERFALNLIPANVAMFLLGPVYMVQFLPTFSSGHSKSVLDMIEARRHPYDYRRVFADDNMRAVSTTLPGVMDLLDHHEYAAALDELRAVNKQLKKIGDWEVAMDSYVMSLAGGYFAGARANVIPLFPQVLREPLAEILDKYSHRPPEEAVTTAP
jgi:hypothetical protein